MQNNQNVVPCSTSPQSSSTFRWLLFKRWSIWTFRWYQTSMYVCTYLGTTWEIGRGGNLYSARIALLSSTFESRYSQPNVSRKMYCFSYLIGHNIWPSMIQNQIYLSLSKLANARRDNCILTALMGIVGSAPPPWLNRILNRFRIGVNIISNKLLSRGPALMTKPFLVYEEGLAKKRTKAYTKPRKQRCSSKGSKILESQTKPHSKNKHFDAYTQSQPQRWCIIIFLFLFLSLSPQPIVSQKMYCFWSHMSYMTFKEDNQNLLIDPLKSRTIADHTCMHANEETRRIGTIHSVETF
jgi:hypothetical protein